jgi:hypothetical protein
MADILEGVVWERALALGKGASWHDTAQVIVHHDGTCTTMELVVPIAR